MQARVGLFQYLFYENEMENFVEKIITCSKKLSNDMNISSFLKNYLFSYTFNINYLTLDRHSESLSKMFIWNYPLFKTELYNIAYQIIKNILIEKTEIKNLEIDLNQLQIKTSSSNLPFYMGLKNKNGIINLGYHSFLKGKVVDISKVNSVIIRYLFCCSNHECKNIFYLKSSEKYGTIYCEKCGQEAKEDITGRIAINERIIKLFLNSGFGFKFIDLSLKGKLSKININVGDNIETIGMVKYLNLKEFQVDVDSIIISSMSQFGRIISNPIKGNFESVFYFLQANFQNIYHPFVKLVFATIIAVIIHKSILFIVKSSREMNVLILLIEKVIENFASRYSITSVMKSLKEIIPIFLTRKNGAILIPHMELLSKQKTDKLNRIISQKIINGNDIISSVVGFYVTEEINPNDLSPYNSFDFIIRVEDIPKNVICDFDFDKLFKDIKNEPIINQIKRSEVFLSNIQMTNSSENIINNYIEYLQNRNELFFSIDYIVEITFGIAAFRNDNEICDDDVLLSIYYIEEKYAALMRNERFFSQYPIDNYFFSSSISNMPITSDIILFEYWKKKLLQEIKLQC